MSKSTARNHRNELQVVAVTEPFVQWHWRFLSDRDPRIRVEPEGSDRVLDGGASAQIKNLGSPVTRE